MVPITLLLLIEMHINEPHELYCLLFPVSLENNLLTYSMHVKCERIFYFCSVFFIINSYSLSNLDMGTNIVTRCK